MINIIKYRKEYTLDEIYNELKTNLDKLDCPDQDFLNYYFHDKIHYIRQEYNFILHEYKGTTIYKQALEKAKLIHFTIKPWDWRSQDYIKRVYLKYSLDKTMIKKVKKERVKRIFFNPLRKIKRLMVK